MYQFVQCHQTVHVEYLNHQIYFEFLPMIMYLLVKAKRKIFTRRNFMITGGVLTTGLVVGVAGLNSHVNKKIRKSKNENR